MRVLSLLFAFLILTLPGWSDESASDGIIRLKVQAAPEPKPALRYQLLPELRDMNPGNPILGYLKCFMEQDPFFSGKEALEQREKWEHMPLALLPLDKLRGYGGIALRQADYAARLDAPDWQVLLKLKADGAFLLIPDVQKMRSLVWALKVRLRGEVAGRQFDQALVTLQTIFAMARHMGEHPTFIANLVGLAFVNIALDPLEEMLQQPGCPNLFWALTQLPRPCVDIHKAIQSEGMIVDGEFAALKHKEPMSAADLEKAVERLQRFYRAIAPPSPKQMVRAWLDTQTKDATLMAAHRQRLIDYGLSPEKLKQFPPDQVVLLAGKLAYETVRDDGLKSLVLPYWEGKAYLTAVAKKRDESPFTWLAVSAVSAKWRQAQTRIEQRLALLRCVEALRLYAAEHDGKLPAQLADMQLPLPVDPFTGQPFAYKVAGATATLRGAPPLGKVRSPGYNGEYEVTIRK